MNLYSYEDWGVDELIVEDSWKRQVGWCSECVSVKYSYELEERIKEEP